MGRSAVRAYATAAFSLVELLTAVSIMLVIIYALYAMFAQTQKALRANVTQVDVLESGRAASEMIGHDMEQITACNVSHAINLYAGMMRIGNNVYVPPLLQTDVDGTTWLRTNLLHELFYLTRQTNRWVGTGYRVLGAANGVGTLYRFTISTNYRSLNATNLMREFVNAVQTTNTAGQTSTNFNRVADGIVHFRVTAYDPDGRRMEVRSTNMYPSYRILRLDQGGGKLGLTSTAFNALDANVILRQQAQLSVQETQISFISNALPGYVELELGVLEPATFKQYQSLKDSPNVASAFLRKQAGKVHLFRQRIPFRTVQQ